MRPISHFRFCPRCGKASREPQAGPAFHCAACGFLYFFNPTVAVAAFVRGSAGRVLLVQRAMDPAKGKWTVPGGFVDPGETAEAALRRELREEVGLDVGALVYLGSEANEYHYREVTYPVLDLFYVTAAEAPERAATLDGVAGLSWLDPHAVAPEELAFPSVRRALEAYCRACEASERVD